MIFYFNASGTLKSAIIEEVHRGSNKANVVYFLCPTAASNIVSAAFRLPDGTATEKHPMNLISGEGLDGVYDENNNKYFAWNYEIPSVVTSKSGRVEAQFFIACGTQGEITATDCVSFTVEKGVETAAAEESDSIGELVAKMVKTNQDVEDLSGALELKLSQKTANGNVEYLYGYNKNGQNDRALAGATPSADCVPTYNHAACIPTSTPTEETDATNKKYDDENFVSAIDFVLDDQTYELTLKAYDKTGAVMATKTVDFPLESVVVGGSYDAQNKKIILNLENQNTVDIPVAEIISGLLSVKTNDGTKTQAYTVCGNEQSVMTVSDLPQGGAIAKYGENGVLRCGTPSGDTDTVNKKYVDDNFKLTLVTNTDATSVCVDVQPNTEYFYGTLADLTITFSNTASVGDAAYVTFKSGETATKCFGYFNEGNTVFNRRLAPSVNVTVELSAVYDGTHWLCCWREV